jgi:hypothetical protein
LGLWLLFRAIFRGSRGAAVTLALWFGSCLLPGGSRWQPMVDWHVWETWRRSVCCSLSSSPFCCVFISVTRALFALLQLTVNTCALPLGQIG